MRHDGEDAASGGGPAESVAPADPETRLVHALEEIARSAGDRVRPTDDDAGPDDVLLDVECAGVRCFVVRTHEAETGRLPKLSPREEEIARMIALGHPNKTIAAVLDISPWTVCTHIRRIFCKYGVRSRAAMVARHLSESAAVRSVDARKARPSHGDRPNGVGSPARPGGAADDPPPRVRVEPTDAPRTTFSSFRSRPPRS